MQGERWIIIDTETDGLTQPIHVVELCGQLMEGWEPAGEPFQMFLNHDVWIPPATVAIHGYTRAFLRRHGREPRAVHEAFREYAQSLPLVAHNLSFDWDRCLAPEWERLGLAPAGRRGFCCMMLARRLALESRSCRLSSLKEHYRLSPSRSHHAAADVQTVVELFQRVYRQRLEAAGFNTFEAVAAFSVLRPMRRCRELVAARAAIPPPGAWSL